MQKREEKGPKNFRFQTDTCRDANKPTNALIPENKGIYFNIWKSAHSFLKQPKKLFFPFFSQEFSEKVLSISAVIISLLFALRLDKMIEWSHWLVFLPIWMWKLAIATFCTSHSRLVTFLLQQVPCVLLPAGVLTFVCPALRRHD